MADTLDLRAVDTTTGMVAIDLACASCQYNLRTLAIGSNCPECGTPVTKSLIRDELRWADAEWLRKTRNGLGILATALALAVVGEVLTLVWWSSPLGRSLAIQWGVSLALGVLMMSLFWLGCWTLASPESPGQPRRPWNRDRLLRICTTAGFVLYVVMWAYPFVYFVWIQGWTRLRGSDLSSIFAGFSRVDPVYLTLCVLSLCLWPLTFVLLILHLRRLAIRGRNTLLTKALIALLGLVCVREAVDIGVWFISYAAAGSGGGSLYWSWYRPAYCARQLVSTTLSLVLLIAGLRLRGRFRRALRERVPSRG